MSTEKIIDRGFVEGWKIEYHGGIAEEYDFIEGHELLIEGTRN